MASSSSHSSQNTNFVRVNVHNSSWRPPGSSRDLKVKTVKTYILLTLLSIITVSSGAAEAVLPSSISTIDSDLVPSHIDVSHVAGHVLDTSERQGRQRWARSTTTEKNFVATHQVAWTPIQPKPASSQKSTSILVPFGRKISRDSQILRKATIVEEPKPSHIRKRNFGATFADALDKENAEKLLDINDLPVAAAIIKPTHGAKPWSEGNQTNIDNSDNIKGDRARGAFYRARESNSRDWERLRVNVKSRPKPEPLNIGSAVPAPSAQTGASSRNNITEQRGRIKLRGSFLGLYSKGIVTPRTSTRPDDDLPQRPDKRERIRNLRIRRPFISDSNKITTTTESPTTTTTSVVTTRNESESSTATTTTSVPTSVSTETVINLKAIVKEYKEIVRTSSTYAPPSSSTQYRVHVKKDELLTLNDATTISTSSATTVTTTGSVTTTITTTPTAQNHNVTDSSPPSVQSLTKNVETLPNSDSSENVINTTSESLSESVEQAASSSKSLKSSSIPSVLTSVSSTVTESKALQGSSHIKQSKAHNDLLTPSSGGDITTRNPIEIQRPREELQKDLIEAIKRKISRTKATQINVNQADSEGRSFSSSARPPLFRPLTLVNTKKNSSKPSDSRVNIFNNLPSKYQASSSIKIPNIAKLENNLEKINEAIAETEFELDTLKNEAANEEHDKNHKFVVKSHSSSDQIVSHSNDAGNQETIRKQLFVARGKTGTDIKYQFDSTSVPTTTTTSSKPSLTTILTSTTATQQPKIVRPEPTTVSSGPNNGKKKPSSEHPSSHFRPNSNWTNGDFIPMPKSNLPPKGDVRLFVVTPKFVTNTPIIEKNNQAGNVTTEQSVVQQPSSSSSNSVSEDITTTAIYVIGVIAVIPVAGLVAWGVRSLLRRKGLAGSESSSETGLNRPITEDDSLQVSGRGGGLSFGPGHSFDPIAEAPENIPKVVEHGTASRDTRDMLGSVWEFPRTRLRLQTVLGEGNFGKVWKAEADDICGYDGTILVAVKTVKENSAQKEVDDLLQEMKIMQEVGSHPNVVTILGVCTEQEPYLLVMEYVMYGKLLTHLREHRMKQSSFFNFSKDGVDDGETLTSKDLTKFAYGVAKGMEYLVSKGIIHRDLAARNILVDHNKNTKISDFGLSRSLRDLGSEMYEQKTKGALPIRWMAPESLYFSVFTPKSDVWGFGILMWEIVTLGSTPYPGMGAREVMKKVRDGYRLERPAHCHPDFYLIIQKCWLGDMNKRPDFAELRKELAKLLEDQHGYIDLQNIPENKYYSMDKNPDEDEKL